MDRMIDRWLFRFRLWRERPETTLILGFASAIFVGTGLLMLPVSSASGRPTDFLTALFTATSATCVTGLIVVDTGSHFSMFGQSVIMGLIQAGGLGIMTFTAFFAWLSRRKVSIQSQLTLRDTFLARSESMSLRRMLLFILSFTALFEGAATIALFTTMNPGGPIGNRIFEALFHSVSAFCNAGFSTYADSLVGFRHSPIVLGVVMLLIIGGGLGYPVYLELWERYRGRLHGRLSLHIKIVLLSTASLIVVGTVLLMLADHRMSLLDALFQSVTTRTAGFNSIPFTHLAHGAALVMIVWMFIGGSPGSCAGGIKTTTLAGIVVIWKDWLFGSTRKRFFSRRLSSDSVQKIKAVTGLAAGYVFLSFFVLLYTEHAILAHDPSAFQDLLFEVVSAMGTVGLSMGVTAHLSAVGKLIIITDMFVGRVGPLAIVTSLLKHRQKSPRVRYPEEKIMIG